MLCRQHMHVPTYLCLPKMLPKKQYMSGKPVERVHSGRTQLFWMKDMTLLLKEERKLCNGHIGENWHKQFSRITQFNFSKKALLFQQGRHGWSNATGQILLQEKGNSTKVLLYYK